MKHFLEAESERMRDQFAVFDIYEHGPRPVSQYRNGYYERDFVARLGTIRLGVARARGESFLPGRWRSSSAGLRSWLCSSRRRFCAAFPLAK